MVGAVSGRAMDGLEASEPGNADNDVCTFWEGLKWVLMKRMEGALQYTSGREDSGNQAREP